MSVLVTGGAGFIGSHLLERLAARGDAGPLVAIDNFNDYYDPALKRANAARLGETGRVQVLEVDFCDAKRMQALFAEHRFRCVVHLGAYAGVRYSVANPSVYERNNIAGTLALLEAARAFPLERFVLASSSTVYGHGAPTPFAEDAALGVPLSPYGASKRAAELLAATYHLLHGVPAVSLRLFSVYGPRLRPDLALSIFTRAIARGDTLPLFGDGSIRRDFTHVSDICAGIERAMTAPDVSGQAINLGHDEPIAIADVIRMLEARLGREARIDRQPEKPGDMPITHADLAKARRLLGYEPRVRFDAGLSEFVDWYRQYHGV